MATLKRIGPGSALKLGAINFINWARILAQIVYYFYSYFLLAKASSLFKIGDSVRFVTLSGNFENILGSNVYDPEQDKKEKRWLHSMRPNVKC